MYDLDDKNTLLLNALSGAIDIVDNEAKDKILTIQRTKYIENYKNDELISQLKERKYLFESYDEEQEVLKQEKYVYDVYMRSQPISFVICPTMLCNLRCTYCFESEAIRNNPTVISNEQVENIFRHIDKIKEERNPKGTIIQLFGGEPLLPSTLEINSNIFRLAKESNCQISIISNGTNIEVYKELLSEYKNDIGNIQITMDGIKEIHDKRRIRIDKTGTFDVICRGIDMLLSMGIKVSLRINVDRVNIDSLKQFVNFVDEKGWDKHQNFICDIAPVTDHHASNSIEGLMAENEIVNKIAEIFPDDKSHNSIFKMTMFRVLNHLNNSLELNSATQETYSMFTYCEANALRFYVFSPDGYVYACPETVGNKEMAIGTYDNELKLISEKVDKWSKRSILRMPKCADCKIAPFCGGGCAYAAVTINGDIDCPICDNAEKV